MRAEGIAPVDDSHLQEAAAVARGVQPVGGSRIGERQHETAAAVVVTDDLPVADELWCEVVGFGGRTPTDVTGVVLCFGSSMSTTTAGTPESLYAEQYALRAAAGVAGAPHDVALEEAIDSHGGGWTLGVLDHRGSELVEKDVDQASLAAEAFDAPVFVGA